MVIRAYNQKFFRFHYSTVATIHPPLIRSDIVALLATNVEALKQRLDALVTAADVVEEKAAAAHHRILASHQLLDEEHATTTDLE
jgi:hypothetical protein